MGVILLSAVTVAYGLVALDFFLKDNLAMAAVFAGYAFSNLGFIWVAHAQS